MEMSDSRWSNLKGGYRINYDPRDALKNIKSGADVKSAWAELWDQLHHQGDVGEASYAAVVEIASLVSDGATSSWNAFALVTVIERCRKNANNPEMPEWLEDDYKFAWESMFASSLSILRHASDEVLITSAIALIAEFKGLGTLSEFALMSESGRRDILVEAGLT